MSFIELHCTHNGKPILINTDNITTIIHMGDKLGTAVMMHERDDGFCDVKESYEEVKGIILAAENSAQPNDQRETFAGEAQS